MPDPYSDGAGRAMAARIAANLGQPTPPNAWRAFSAQVANETANGNPSTRGVVNNNPFNLTTGGGSITWPGQVGADGPFAVFASVNDGVNAAATNYMAPSYSGVISAFQFGDPLAIAGAIESSPWAAGGYGGALTRSLGGGSTGPASAPPLSASSAPSSGASGGSSGYQTVGSRIAGLFPSIALPFAAAPSLTNPLGVGQKTLMGPAKVLVTIAVVGVIFIGAMRMVGGEPVMGAKAVVGRGAA